MPSLSGETTQSQKRGRKSTMVNRQQCDLFARHVSLSADGISEKSTDGSHCAHGTLYAASIRIQAWQERIRFSLLYLFSLLGGRRFPASSPFSSILTQKGNMHIVDRDGKLRMVRSHFQQFLYHRPNRRNISGDPSRKPTTEAVVGGAH